MLARLIAAAAFRVVTELRKLEAGADGEVSCTAAVIERADGSGAAVEAPPFGFRIR